MKGLFVRSIIALFVLSGLSCAAQETKKSKRQGAPVASIPKAPQKLTNASWSVTTDASKPDIVTIAFDLSQLSILQGMYDIRCTVKYSGERAETETFNLDFLEGGKVTVAEFKTTLKFSNWKNVQVEGQALDGTLRSHVVAYQEPKASPTT
jgi:hypothetical protein